MGLLLQIHSHSMKLYIQSQIYVLFNLFTISYNFYYFKDSLILSSDVIACFIMVRSVKLSLSDSVYGKPLPFECWLCQSVWSDLNNINNMSANPENLQWWVWNNSLRKFIHYLLSFQFSEFSNIENGGFPFLN